MRENHVGSLVVVDETEGGQRVAVVLTDRDIVTTVVARAVDPSNLRVGDVMTRDPIAATETDPIDAALKRMRQSGVRRVPVVNAAQRLVGVLSLDDVLDAVADQLSSIAGSIRNEQRIERTLRS
jgi:CBS domain-containing protein